MQTFTVKVGKPTRRGLDVIHEFAVNSESSRLDVHNAYTKQYAGLTIEVSEVKEIQILDNTVIELEREVDPFESRVSMMIDHYGSTRYKASISKDDIKNWGELTSKINTLTKELGDAETEFQNAIVEMFGLESVENFARTYQSVSFTFVPRQFKFISDKSNNNE